MFNKIIKLLLMSIIALSLFFTKKIICQSTGKEHVPSTITLSWDDENTTKKF